MSTDIARPNTATLDELATRIKAAHAAVLDAAMNAVRKAIDAGMDLIDAKRQTKHGEWLRLLRACGLPERTATRYMDIARNRVKLEQWLGEKSATMADLTLTQAERITKDKFDKDCAGDLGKYQQAEAALITPRRSSGVGLN